jgi:aspartokinase/homoserine dehydrogenase 1
VTRPEHKLDKNPGERKKPLRVMKFGGTSVGDAACIRRVADIVSAATLEATVVVVVSAMGGVTNRLIEAANEAKSGNETAVAEIFFQLRRRHEEALGASIHSAAGRKSVESKLHDLFAEGERMCQKASLARELTPRVLDAISALGERLCAPLVAGALSQAGIATEAVDATELVATDSSYGGAEPLLDLTRQQCQARLSASLQKNVVPVVTGYIGATQDGVLTTLGRGGSDYSATILGAALHADEVVIWSDVHGLLTADPKLVPEASTITEISYREAAELAYFGAKVLHPKTLRPVIQLNIPIWIKNTFAPEEQGTKITQTGPASAGGVKALTAIREASLITVAGSAMQCTPNALARTVATAAAVGADMLLVSQSSAHNDICLVIPSAIAQKTVEALRREFSKNLLQDKSEHFVFDSAVSVITLVGQKLRGVAGTALKTFSALGRENIHIIATVLGSSDCTMSFVVSQGDLRIALNVIHRALELGVASNRRPVASDIRPTAGYPSGQATAD